MDNQRAKAAATFGADFMREARSNPQPPKSSVTSSQAQANKRPIPTYASGGLVTAPATTRPTKVRPTVQVTKARPMVDRQPTGSRVAKYAAGGIGKVRKGQAEQPGRGPKMY